MDEIKNRVRQYRKKENMSIEELAVVTKLSASHLTKIERGERLPSLPNAKKIAAALKATLDELF